MTHTTENPLNLSLDQRQTPVVDFGATNIDQKFVFLVEKKETLNTLTPSKKVNLPEYELNRDWEYSQNCNDFISERARIKQNKKFWKNELKLPKFVQNIINYCYILHFLSSLTPFYVPNNKSSLKKYSLS